MHPEQEALRVLEHVLLLLNQDSINDAKIVLETEIQKRKQRIMRLSSGPQRGGMATPPPRGGGSPSPVNLPPKPRNESIIVPERPASISGSKTPMQFVRRQHAESIVVVDEHQESISPRSPRSPRNEIDFPTQTQTSMPTQSPPDKPATPITQTQPIHSGPSPSQVRNLPPIPSVNELPRQTVHSPPPTPPKRDRSMSTQVGGAHVRQLSSENLSYQIPFKPPPPPFKSNSASSNLVHINPPSPKNSELKSSETSTQPQEWGAGVLPANRPQNIPGPPSPATKPQNISIPSHQSTQINKESLSPSGLPAISSNAYEFRRSAPPKSLLDPRKSRSMQHRSPDSNKEYNRVVQEVLQTERDYVRNLSVVAEVNFYKQFEISILLTCEDPNFYF
jgi:hypothetical protein